MPKFLKITSGKDFDSLPDLYFWCEGCQTNHFIILRDVDETRLTDNDRKIYEEMGKPKWTFNNDFDKPAFSPSIHVKKKIGEKIVNGKKENIYETLCHSFVRDGKIQYLNDCKHKLAGHTIDLPDLDNDDQTKTQINNLYRHGAPCLNNQNQETMAKKITWMQHVKKVQKENPGLPYQEALQEASKTWQAMKLRKSIADEEVTDAEIAEAKKGKKPKLPKISTTPKAPFKISAKEQAAGEEQIEPPTQFKMVLQFRIDRKGQNADAFIYDCGKHFIELPYNTGTCPPDMEGLKMFPKPQFNKGEIIAEYRNNDYDLMYGQA